jgi:dihydroneopterin aldolase
VSAKDTIFVDGLEIRTVLGVEDWEREEPQTILVDLRMSCDAAHAARTDDVADALNYRTVAKDALAFGAAARFRLVETFAERLADHLIARHGIERLWMRVAKPGAVRFSRTVGVELERVRRV